MLQNPEWQCKTRVMPIVLYMYKMATFIHGPEFMKLITILYVSQTMGLTCCYLFYVTLQSARWAFCNSSVHWFRTKCCLHNIL